MSRQNLPLEDRLEERAVWSEDLAQSEECYCHLQKHHKCSE